MGAPPAGKGGKKGPPPRPQGSDAPASKGKSKDKGASGSAVQFKPDAFLIWWSYGSRQQEDGHWGGDFLVGDMPMGTKALFETEDEKAAFLADCPFLSTLVMLNIGQSVTESFAYRTQQVRDVKLGDGRGQADEVELKRIELSDAEKQKQREDYESFCERVKVTLDWHERAEKYLSNHCLSDRRAEFCKRAEDILSRMKQATGNSSAGPRPEVSAEERRKREQGRAEKELALRKKEQDLLENRRRRMAHLQTLAPASISDVQWKNAKDLHFIDGGSGGVLLVDLIDASVALKLQGKTAANEMLAQHVADAVQVAVAHVRVVKSGDDEHSAIMDAAKACEMHGTDPTMGFFTFFGDAPDAIREKLGLPKDWDKSASDQARVCFFGVLEFVPGHALMGMEGNRAMQEPSEELLGQLGSLCALDVLINNMDRMPLPLWQNDGNLGNVMLAQSASQIVGIDQQVNLVTEGPARDRYMDKVREIVRQCLPSGDSKPIVAKLQQALLENCGIEFSERHACSIVRGMESGFIRIASSFKSGELSKLLDDGEAMCVDRLLIDGPCAGTKPVLHTLEAMKDFVNATASAITGEITAAC